MDSFLRQLNKLVQLNDQEISELKMIVNTKVYEKGDIVLKVNKVNKNLYFIDDGLVKVSFFDEDKEYVMKFFYKDEFCAILDSLTTGLPSSYSITALLKVSLIEIDYVELLKLATLHQAFEKIISGVPSMATKKMMARIRELLETDAKERYLNFLENNAHLMQHISLRDLSAYLGISQVSLSRIRAKM